MIIFALLESLLHARDCWAESSFQCSLDTRGCDSFNETLALLLKALIKSISESCQMTDQLRTHHHQNHEPIHAFWPVSHVHNFISGRMMGFWFKLFIIELLLRIVTLYTRQNSILISYIF